MKKFSGRGFIIVSGLIATLMVFGGIALASGPVHWSYEGADGPEHWGELSPDFAACSTGAEQSPIDIARSAPVNPADIAFAYGDSAVNILNNGHTVQVNYDAGSSMTVAGKTYNLLQFHFHAHSEHTLEGAATPMELHLVHQNEAGQLAVVGLMITAGAENAALAPVMDNLPPQESDPAPVSGATVNIANALPATQSYYRYDGSLTTPPCSEGVTWLVMTEPIELSTDQIAAFTQIFANNFRPVQPFNERAFLLTAETEPVATSAAEPATLPQSGGAAFPAAPLLLGLGLLTVLAGTRLHRYHHR